MPGVVVTTAVRSGPSAVNTASTSTAFVVGVTSRGPSNSANVVGSLAQYEALYGGYISTGYVHQTVKMFFEEGGARMYISRAVADTAASASCALLDAATPTPATSIVLTAAGKGAWANSGILEATVTIVATTQFFITIFLDGKQVYMTSTYSSRADAVEEINNSAVAALYVTASSGASVLIPAAVVLKDFTGGLDGNGLDGDNIVTAAQYFTYDLGPGAIMAPGFYDTVTRDALKTNANANHRIFITSFDKGTLVGGLNASIASYIGSTNSEHMSAYWPWVKVPNGLLTMTIPPEGFVAARRSAVLNSNGPGYAYAGESGAASYVVGLETKVSKEDTDTADAVYVNAIRIVQNSIRVYGARSLSTDVNNFKFITGQEVLNYIVYAAERDLENLLFQPIDGRGVLFSRIASTLTAVMAPLAQSGALYAIYDIDGKEIDPGYSVKVSEADNPVSQLAQGKIVAKVGARVSGIGDKIEVEVVKSSLVSSLV